MRIALGISYNGSQFHGWQIQPVLRTVQQDLESALSQIANEPITVHCAGRTDAGVHASGQVVHFETTAVREMMAWRLGTNRYLAPDLAVRWAIEVPADFHARFSALSRTYHYIIYNHAARPIFKREFVTWIPRPLNAEAMQQAGYYLLGEHDFSAFRASECQSTTPMRNLKQLVVYRKAELVIIEITANAFLHHMVRNIVGMLLIIGQGKQTAAWAKALLAAKDRTLAPATAPAQGLFLSKVTYPENFFIPTELSPDIIFR